MIDNDKNIELVSHLFYDCNVVLNFWIQVKAWLSNIPNEVDIPIDRKAVLFGISNEPKNLVPNFIKDLNYKSLGLVMSNY